MLTLLGCFGDDESPKDGPLTNHQEDKNKEYESQIEGGLTTMSEALYCIHLDRLYRGNYNDFDAYLAGRWPEIHRATAYRKINYVAVLKSLEEQVPDLPKPGQGAGQLLHKVSDVAGTWKECVDRGLTTVEGVAQVIDEKKGPVGDLPPAADKPPQVTNRVELHVPAQFEALVQNQFGFVLKPHVGRNIFRRSVTADKAAELVVELGTCLRDNNITPFSLRISL